jgi:hypothetical protein
MIIGLSQLILRREASYGEMLPTSSFAQPRAHKPTRHAKPKEVRGAPQASIAPSALRPLSPLRELQAKLGVDLHLDTMLRRL